MKVIIRRMMVACYDMLEVIACGFGLLIKGLVKKKMIELFQLLQMVFSAYVFSYQLYRNRYAVFIILNSVL